MGNTIILRRRNGKFTMDNLPKFVKLSGTCLRLRIRYSEIEYWRDGGCWGVGVKIIDGKLYSTHTHVENVNNKLLIPTTQEEWRKCNGQYAPNKI